MRTPTDRRCFGNHRNRGDNWFQPVHRHRVWFISYLENKKFLRTSEDLIGSFVERSYEKLFFIYKMLVKDMSLFIWNVLSYEISFLWNVWLWTVFLFNVPTPFTLKLLYQLKCICWTFCTSLPSSYRESQKTWDIPIARVCSMQGFAARVCSKGS